jgi:hypothetical protein
VIVEGPSDQHYLTAIKLHLIKIGKLKPSREMVFPPAGGPKGVKAVTAITVAKDDKLPQVLFDGDAMGLQTIHQLKDSLYMWMIRKSCFAWRILHLSDVQRSKT